MTSTLSALSARRTETCALDIGGMTCASCVGRVEKALKKLDGVADARVNLATETATVDFDPQQVGLAEFAAVVAKSGYTATPRHEERAPEAPEPTDDDGRDAELDGVKRRWQVALTSGLGLMVLMYVPLPLDTMDWLMPAILVVATFVQFWAGRTIYAAAWAAARHGATNMNTLVALGTAVAYGYSAFVTLWPAAAESVGPPAARLLRDVAGDHRAGAHGPVDGDPRQEADHRRDHRPGRARAADRPRPARATPRSTCRSPTSWSATWSACAPARRSRSTASSPPAARRSTRAC